MTGQSPEAQKTQIVLKTCILLVSHFRNLHENKGLGFHTRLFSHILHPEREFVFAGRSVNVNQDTDTHPEHICRIPDDRIDSRRYPLFMARAVLKELIESLQSTQGVKPC